eukprot:Nk52_evm63s223 gene=Nk52_evmTU63s223
MASLEISSFDEYSNDYGADELDYNDEEPSLEEMSIDDSLSPIERLSKYSKSDLVLHRLFVVKDIANAVSGIEDYSSDDCGKLIEILHDLFNDPEALIRQALLEEAPEIAKKFVAEGDSKGYEHMSVAILEHVNELCLDNIDQVRVASYSCLIELLGILSEEDVEKKVCKQLEKLSEDEAVESYRIEVLNFIYEACPLLDQKVLEAYFVPIVTLLAKDPMFRVRKACAAAIGNLCKNLGKGSSVDLLLPIFCKFSTDDIWGVRKACAESHVLVSESVSDDVRADALTKLFDTLATDQSRWVRIAAFAQLGPFIATFTPNKPIFQESEGENEEDSGNEEGLIEEANKLLPIPHKLLVYYAHMADPINSKSIDNEIVLNCAFNFPAVIFTLGPQCWVCVRKVYKTLSADLHWKVRKTLAHSIHEVAALIGKEKTERDLVPIFECFIKDLDEVRIGVVKYLSKFLNYVSEKKRREFLPMFAELQQTENKNNWRFRSLLSEQITDLFSFYSRQEVIRYICPLALDLASDEVSYVRHTAVSKLAVVLSDLLHAREEDKSSTLDEVDDIKEAILNVFAHNQSYQYRISFVEFCSHLAFELEKKGCFKVFETNLFEKMLVHTTDPVPNVRIAAARTLVSFLNSLESLKSNTLCRLKVESALNGLKEDKDKDVVFYASA